ncbi:MULTISPECIES: retropepsin-like aspartic protease family protein [Ramlibacter]
MPRAVPLASWLLLACAAAQSQTVAVQGMLGGKPLLVVDGGAPKTVAVGDTWKGVKVVSTAGDQAVLEVGGRRQTLRVGESPGNFGGGPARPGGSRIVLSASSGGHFTSEGSINGRAAMFMVDTGATLVGLGATDAERLGIDYKAGQPVRMSTANGVVMGWQVKLPSVRLGDVEVREVDAVVGSGSMPYVLLGNSFLGRFSMRRDNEQMVLERRY